MHLETASGIIKSKRYGVVKKQRGENSSVHGIQTVFVFYKKFQDKELMKGTREARNEHNTEAQKVQTATSP